MDPFASGLKAVILVRGSAALEEDAFGGKPRSFKPGERPRHLSQLQVREYLLMDLLLGAQG